MSPKELFVDGKALFTYKYSGKVVEPIPATREVQKLFDRIKKEHEDSKTTETIPNYVLINKYRNTHQDCIGWHSDKERCIKKEAPIYGINVGVTRDFYIRQKKPRKTRQSKENKPQSKVVYVCPLVHGSRLTMGGEMQKNFKHCVLAEKKRPDRGIRFNLTIRCLV
jgi:alkylated DNA repair dioxygenase AlkB